MRLCRPTTPTIDCRCTHIILSKTVWAYKIVHSLHIVLPLCQIPRCASWIRLGSDISSELYQTLDTLPNTITPLHPGLYIFDIHSAQCVPVFVRMLGTCPVYQDQSNGAQVALLGCIMERSLVFGFETRCPSTSIGPLPSMKVERVTLLQQLVESGETVSAVLWGAGETNATTIYSRLRAGSSVLSRSHPIKCNHARTYVP